MFKRKTTIFSILLFIALVISMTACANQKVSQSSSASASADRTAKDLKISAILIDSSSDVTTQFGEDMKAYAESLGAEFSLQYHDRDVAKEQSMIENAINAGVDVLILDPETDTECADEITQATQAGIVTIIYNMEPKAEYTYRFSGPHYQMGYDIGTAAAKWANENLLAKGEPVNVVVNNVSISPNAVERHDGIVDALAALCPEAKILACYEGAYKEDGLKMGENIQQAQPDTNLIVTINDNTATGAYEAFKAAGRGNDNIGIFGIDGTEEALKDIAEGSLYRATICTDHVYIAKLIIDAGVDKALGNPDAPAEQNNFWTTNLVTIDNVKDYIK